MQLVRLEADLLVIGVNRGTKHLQGYLEGTKVNSQSLPVLTCRNMKV